MNHELEKAIARYAEEQMKIAEKKWYQSWQWWSVLALWIMVAFLFWSR
jgi:hypothetical protein